MRSDLYKHIVISGGSTMYPGLPSRLKREIKQLYLVNVLKGDVTNLSVSCIFLDALIKTSSFILPIIQKFKIKVEAQPGRKDMVFFGGSILAKTMKDKPEFWLTREDWKELGPDRMIAEKLNSYLPV